MSSTIAHPPGDCCFRSIKHSGDAVGHTISLGGMQTYVSEPPSQGAGNKIILFLADIYGPMYTNSQLLMDWFATNGFMVISPDYFFSDAVHYHTEEGFNRAQWVADAKVKADKVFPGWVDAVKAKYGEEKDYFVVGYCFGAPFVCDLASTDQISAGAFVHPALLTETHFTNLKQPLLLSCAEIDHTFPAPLRHRAEDLLIEHKKTFHLQLFSGVQHGFGTRGDPEVEATRWAKEESARSVVGWFERFAKK
ncbi:dienelactone hydrolase [Cyathus striatus]|nr:dienelactone hydrolase [Cyathus striatus]